MKAFGIAGYVDGAFYDMVSEYLEQNIRNLGPQHLAEIAFGANAGGCVTERMQSSIEKVAADYVKQADMRVLFLPAFRTPNAFASFLSIQSSWESENATSGCGGAVRLILMPPPPPPPRGHGQAGGQQFTGNESC